MGDFKGDIRTLLLAQFVYAEDDEDLADIDQLILAIGKSERIFKYNQ